MFVLLILLKLVLKIIVNLLVICSQVRIAGNIL